MPLDRELAASFDPSSVPTLRKCAEALDAAHTTGTAIAPGKEISATALHVYEANFDAFLKRSENAIRAERVRASHDAESMDF